MRARKRGSQMKNKVLMRYLVFILPILPILPNDNKRLKKRTG